MSWTAAASTVENFLVVKWGKEERRGKQGEAGKLTRGDCQIALLPVLEAMLYCFQQYTACIENAFSHTECLWIILLTSLHPEHIHQGRIKELLSICTNYKFMQSAEISPRGYYNNSVL